MSSRGRPLGRAVGLGDGHGHDQAVTVLAEGMTHMCELRFFTPALAIELRLRVGAALVRGVGPLLAVEIDGDIPRLEAVVILPIVVRRVLRPETLGRREAFDQRAVDS